MGRLSPEFLDAVAHCLINSEAAAETCRVPLSVAAPPHTFRRAVREHACSLQEAFLVGREQMLLGNNNSAAGEACPQIYCTVCPFNVAMADKRHSSHGSQQQS